MNFCSDNVSGVSPEILSALTTANNGPAMPYGADEVTARVVACLRALFDAPAAEIVLMSTGSSANALALATMTPPFAAVYCHTESHVNVDECGAPEFYTGGAKLVPVEGQHAKMSVEALESAITGAGVVHHVQPAAVSVTQVTEAGTLYTLEELRAISNICKRHELKLHMDGARFANAIEALGCTPAACSHELGVDALSFGATKNGAMCAEAILFFDPVLAREAGYRRKRAGHLFSKMRFLSAQFDAYLADDLWRRNARHANAMAARLAAAPTGTWSLLKSYVFAYGVRGVLEMRVSVRDGGVTSAAAVAQMMMHVWVCRIVLTTQLSISISFHSTRTIG